MDSLFNEEEFLSSRDTETEHVCGTCNKLKPLSEFYKDGKDNHGNTKYRRDCKECYKRTRYFEAKMKRQQEERHHDDE